MMKVLGSGRGVVRSGRLRSLALATVSGCAIGMTGVASAQDVEAPAADAEAYESAQPVESDGASYPVGTIRLRYASEHAGHPPLDDFLDTEFELLQTPRGLVAPRPGQPTLTLTIEDINAQPARQLYASAIQAINRALIRAFNERGIIGVFVAPEELDLSTGGDLRGEGETAITLVVFTARAEDVRSIGSGERVDEQDRINLPIHRRIRQGSPVKPGGRDEPASLLRKDLLDEYVLWLNRHPGRRVDVAVSPGLEPGAAVLDYYVSENKPWSVYFQVSNTGTDNTANIRERFGLIHNQLTNNDDVLTIDYLTANFDESNAINATYERPVPGADRLRVGVFGGYNEYEASDVGQAGQGFEGDGFNVGGELILNVFQRRATFLDIAAGARYEDIEVENQLVGIEGEEELIVPYVSARVSRQKETSSFTGEVALEFALGGDLANLERLGRTSPDEDTAVFSWDMRYSFFLEPLVNGTAWEDVSTPRSSTLAHEVLVRFQGQNALGNRLIPNHQGVAGGFYTVRGYDASEVAGDNIIVFNTEYRFHVPRVFAIERNPRQLFGEPFRFAPQQVYGRPDWDLILLTFIDVGYVSQSDELSFESSDTLVGTGVGIEVQFRRNVTLRSDWGIALSDVGDGAFAESGDNRMHFVLTFLH